MKVADHQLHEIAEDFRRLKQSLVDKGLFSTSRSRLAFDISLHFVLYTLGYWLANENPILALLWLTGASINLVWWIHDSGHDALFASKDWSKFFIELLGVLFLGMLQVDYHYGIHRRHHGFTNILGKDTALETGPIVWHKKMLKDGQRLVRRQSWLWVGIILPLTYPLISFKCLKVAYEQGKYTRLAFWGLRWAVFLFVLKISFWILFLPVLAAGFVLGFAASLNHFHLEISEKQRVPFPAQVFLVTQNIDSPSSFVTWLTGGLNFHIEHHLFPTMPSRNYHLAQEAVRAFASKHSLPYHSCSSHEAVVRLLVTLADPIEDRKWAVK